MAFDVNFAIDEMYPAASAAYLAMTTPQPPLPAGYTLVGTITANPQAAAAAVAAAPAAAQALPHLLVSESSIFGLVCWNADEKSLIVAIRGTKTPIEWIADLDAVPAIWPRYPAAGLVHMGFQLVYEHIAASIKDLVAPYVAQADEIWVTGHSLGGALAILTAYDLAKSNPTAKVPELYTFAGPRVGNPIFAADFDTLIPQCQRIVNFMDVVPQLPLPPAYEHVGTGTLVFGGFKLDPAYAHALTTYLNGLQKLQGAAGTNAATGHAATLHAAATLAYDVSLAEQQAALAR
ncbi:lipase family protein [Silvibacterium dinghuense]|nr:lipase family protein [Silvibacterium dinghuense]GGH01354.1 hypothetical protein GCM10011586_16250 [Silvibacterium dinghuense]